jgi:hypothetical protein
MPFTEASFNVDRPFSVSIIRMMIANRSLKAFLLTEDRNLGFGVMSRWHSGQTVALAETSLRQAGQKHLGERITQIKNQPRKIRIKKRAMGR